MGFFVDSENKLRNESMGRIRKTLTGATPDRTYDPLLQAAIDYEVCYEDTPCAEAALVLL